MALEDVVKGLTLSEATAAAAQNNQMTDAQALYGALAYIGENADDWVNMQDNAAQLDTVAKYLTPVVKRKALDDTAANVRGILGSFDDNTLTALAIGISPDAEELKQYSQILETQNYEAMRGLLTKRNDDGSPDSESLFNQLYLPTARPDQLTQVVAVRQRALRDEFVSKYLSRNAKSKKGEEPKREFSKKNAGDYVAKIAKDIGDDAYATIGGIYMERVSQEARESGSSGSSE